MRINVTCKGRVIIFDSPYSDTEAVAVLRAFMARGRVLSSFANDLVTKAAEPRGLSRAQFDWVHKLVADAEGRALARTPGTVNGQTRKPGSHKWSHPGT